MKLRSPSALLFALAGLASVSWADWPTHRFSPTRNAATPEALPPGAPVVAWRHRPAFRPEPAWHGPAKWDAYAELRGLHSMRGYDQAYHAISAGGAVYYGSSTEHCVRRLDAATGEVDWTHHTDGPVRVAPTFVADRLYFGSDDGHAYCLDAASGELVWRVGPQASTRRIVNNGNLIPLWPVRTGVSVVGDTAYFAASLLPWEPSHLYAVDAATGEVRYTQRLDEATFEGPLVASPRLLLAPQGRVAPVLFDRATGERLGQLPGGGGSFCVLLDDGTSMHGPGNKAGWVTQSDSQTRETLATHEAAREVVNNGDATVFITDKAVIAIDYQTKNRLWRADVADPLSLIAVGDDVIVGSLGRVTALDGDSGEKLWETGADGRVKGLAFDGGRLYASLDTGEIVAIGFDEQAEASPIATPASAGAETEAESTHRVAVGPWLRFLDESTAEVRWRSAEPTPSAIEFRDTEGEVREVAPDDSPSTEHRVRLTDLGLNESAHYRIVDGDARTAWYECDTFFNYSPQRIGAASSSSEAPAALDRLLETRSSARGVALVLGGDGAEDLAAALAQRSEMRVIVFAPDRAAVDALRYTLTREGLYGGRVTAHVATANELALVTDQIASAVLVTPQSPYDPGEAARLVEPGGVGVVARAEDEPLVFHGPPIDGAGDWSHVYGRPDNSAFGGETLGGVQKTDDLVVQWIGRPGPRYQADRNGRKTPPLSAGGRLFLQGLDRIVAVDAYNGSILWSLETPHFRRFNMPRDCGNWCATDTTLYAAVRDRCWRINAATGEVVDALPVVADGLPEREGGYDWGYVGRSGGLLLGSANAAGANWTDFWGGLGWYDATEGPPTHQVVSDRLFALDAETAEERWRVDRLLFNSTITVSDGAVTFVECRDESLQQGGERRLPSGEHWDRLWLTSIDLATGEEAWSRRLDDVAAGGVAVWLAGGSGRLVLVTSAEAKFDVNAFDASTGEPLWRREADWGKGKADHGTHLSRPAIVGTRLIVRPAVFDLATGATDTVSMPVSGCGTYACTTDALFFRAWSGQQFAVWSPETNDYTRWSRLRPDCWLSTIPAAGMLLSPEGGGGCSCGAWLETSLAFAPKSRIRAADE